METAGTGRLEAFSDGVFAIAATLLVLSFSVGTVAGSQLDTALFHLWPAYLAYATSFLTIGIIWMNHHHCVSLMGRADRTLLFVNLILLMIVAFFPFPTKLVADYLRTDGEQAAVLAYTGTLTAMAVVYNAWWRYAATGRRLIAEGVPDAEIRAVTRAFNPGIVIYGVTFLVAFASPVASVILTFLIAAFYLPSAALFNRA